MWRAPELAPTFYILEWLRTGLVSCSVYGKFGREPSMIFEDSRQANEATVVLVPDRGPSTMSSPNK